MTDARPMTLSNGERLILVMLCEIYEKLGIKGEVDAKFVQSAIYSGNLWGLQWHYPGIFDVEDHDREVVSEVANILDMWWSIESAYAKFTKAEREKVAASDTPFAKNVKFPGFDGNNEGEYLSVARFLVDDLERFTHFKGRDLNSHMPSLGVYRRMFEVFDPMRRELALRTLGPDDIIELLRAAMHRSNR
jgi:uncharacterized protein